MNYTIYLNCAWPTQLVKEKAELNERQFWMKDILGVGASSDIYSFANARKSHDRSTWCGSCHWIHSTFNWPMHGSPSCSNLSQENMT